MPNKSARYAEMTPREIFRKRVSILQSCNPMSILNIKDKSLQFIFGESIAGATNFCQIPLCFFFINIFYRYICYYNDTVIKIYLFLFFHNFTSEK